MSCSFLQGPLGDAWFALFGEAVKVKNTFIDGVVNLSEPAKDLASQSCPAEFSDVREAEAAAVGGTHEAMWSSSGEQAVQGPEEKFDVVAKSAKGNLVAGSAKVRACGGGGRRARHPKLCCHFYLDENMLHSGFDLNKKLIGHGGANTKKIFQATAAKLRLRGRGSGHVEERGREAPVHLMLAVTSEIGQEKKFLVALESAAELLERVTSRYRDPCSRKGVSSAAPLFWIGELSERAAALVGTDSERAMLGPVAVTVQLADGPVRQGMLS